MYYTGRWGRERSVPGVYQADETIADNTLLISPTIGVIRLTKIKTINSANKKRMQFWDDSNEFINDDFVEDETVFPLDNKAFLVGDPFKRVLLHIPRNHWLRTQIMTKDYGPILDQLTFKCMQYENLIKEMMEDYDKGFDYWTAKIRTARQVSGIGYSAWQVGRGGAQNLITGGEE